MAEIPWPYSPFFESSFSSRFVLWVNRNYYIAIFISYPISTQGPSGWYGSRVDLGTMIWKLPYHNLFIIHFSFWQVCLFDIVCGVRGNTAECSECGDMGFLPKQKKPYHPYDLVIWVFLQSKKALSSMLPIITPFALHKSDMCLKAMLVSHMQNEHIF